MFQNIPLKVVDLFENQTYVEYYEYEDNDTTFWNKMCQIDVKLVPYMNINRRK